MLLSVLLAAAVAADDARNPLHPRIDAAIAAGHPDFATLAAPPADDAEFVRRAYLDLAGTIPTVAEVRAFLDDKSPGKRAGLIDQLLASPGYVRRMVWFLDVTLMERRPDVKVTRTAWEEYLRAAVANNRPYDALVREMLSNDGADPKTRPAAKFLLDRNLERDPVTRDLSRVFLGRDIRCAQCHDHPSITDYKQAEYFGLAAFLNRSALFPSAAVANAAIGEKADGDVTFVSVFDKDKKQNTTPPMVLGGKPFAEPKPEKGKEYKVAPAANVRPVPTFSRRELLAGAITSPENTAFARTAVNRVWAMMLGRGLVEAVDWDHPGNPPSHPELLDLLSAEFVRHNHDVKWLVRQIALTRTYQRSSEAPAALAKLESVPADRYLVANLKPLTAEHLAFAVAQAGGQPGGAGSVGTFRAMFGGRPGESQADFTATLDQTLFLKYGPALRGVLAPRAAALAKLPDEAVADELFLSVLSRRPTADEAKDVADALRRAKDRTAALSELVWALVASAEFRFNH
ncbi:MAG: hypothetical protein C0501_04570 [Isosphaera sp.]|nr:hypothetical protein [Isosphaera sp.]